MYHRFNENKYPSTNIQMDIFEKQMEIIKEQDYEFYDPKNFVKEFEKIKENKKILITIDDAFKSFYTEAWPFLKEKKIPFILFVSTEPIGKYGYMNWDEIKEIDNSEFGYIGHHSHTHEYLIDMSDKEFENDIETATKIFKRSTRLCSKYIFLSFWRIFSIYEKIYFKKF